MRLCRSNNTVTDLHPAFIIVPQSRHPGLGFDSQKASGLNRPDRGVFAPD
jgi:hypothetical protein